MITHLGEDDLLFSPDGFLTPREVTSSTSVIGIGKNGKPEARKATVSGPERGDNESYILFTSQGEVVLTRRSSLYIEGKDGRAEALIAQLLDDRYSGREDFVSLSNSIPDGCRFLQKPPIWDEPFPLTKETAFILGTLVRRVSTLRDKLVLAARTGVARRLVRDFEQMSDEDGSLRVTIRLVEGRIWSWLKLEGSKELRQVSKWWPAPEHIPLSLRRLGRPLFKKWCAGAKIATSNDADSLSCFTFLAERQLRQLLCFCQVLDHEGYDYLPSPIYDPMDVTLKFGGAEEASARIVSISGTREPIYRLLTETPYWSPIVNFILLRPTQA